MSENLDARVVAERLGLPERTADRLRDLATAARPAGPGGPELPDDAEAEARLTLLGVRADLVPGILAARPDAAAHPEVWWILESTYRNIVGHLGSTDGFEGWPPLPATAGEVTRHVYLWTFVAAVPYTLRLHAERTVPEELSRLMVRGIGGGVTESQAMFGVSGLLFGQWTPPLVLRGVTYELGRLAYDFGTAINIHIPNRDQKGPLDPAACDASIVRAKEFAARHFPEHPSPRFVCHSWLLDPQLAEYLPTDSNLVRFQRRFLLTPDQPWERADHDVLGYVFGRHHPSGEDIPSDVLAELPQDSTLRRAFVAHLRSGRHWHGRTGWLSA